MLLLVHRFDAHHCSSRFRHHDFPCVFSQHHYLISSLRRHPSSANVRFGIPNVSPALEQDLADGLVKVEELLNSHIKGSYPLVEETSHLLLQQVASVLRPLLTLISSHLGDSGRYGVIEAGVVCELTHLATLYHDDVMDEALLRRGVEMLILAGGIPLQFSLAIIFFCKGLESLADLGPEAVRLQARYIRALSHRSDYGTQGSSC